MLTGTRVAALTSLRLSHVNITGGYVDQDARTVRTKFAKTFRTYFEPVSERALRIVAGWHGELSSDVMRGPGDALFPSTAIALNPAGGFALVGLHYHGWSTSEPVREVFRRAFSLAGLPYYNPHSLREMLVWHLIALNLSAEGMKAISQNLGHADVLTTFTSYGALLDHRQGELVRTAVRKDNGPALDDEALFAAIRSRLAKPA
jgi:integrase